MSPQTVTRDAVPHSYWPERLFSLLLAGLVAFLWLHVLPVRTNNVGATDFKTIYASAWNLRQARDAYQFQNITAAYLASGVIPPPTAYGHIAMYPPFNLVPIVPITLLPMAPAIWLWCIAGTIAIALAFAALAQAAGEEFGLRRGGRFVLILIAVLWPVFSYATIVQNVSLLATALSLLVVTTRNRVWLRSIALAFALLLKPHVALFPALALLLLRSKDGRRVAVQAMLLCAGLVAVGAIWMALDHQLAPQLRSYLGALRNEAAEGSMNPARRDIMAAGLQITSLSSLIGFWQNNPAYSNGISWTLLASLAAILLWSTLRINRLPEDALARSRFATIAAWCSFGMIATYHRTHDGLILAILLPCLIPQLKPAPFRLRPLLLPGFTFALFMLMAAIIPLANTGGPNGSNSFRNLLLFRQGPLFAASLAALLAFQLVLLARKPARA